MIRKSIVAAAALIAACLALTARDSAAADTAPSARCRAAVLVYHHIGYLRADPTQTERNVTTSPQAFEQHMKLLEDEGFSVIPYDDLVGCMYGGPATPPKSVVITFDDGLRSQYTQALPILEKHGHTATFFIVTDYAGTGSRLMDWDEIRDLERRGMTIGSHTRTHPWLTRLTDKMLIEQLRSSKSRLERELGHEVNHLAYPFGAFNDRVGQASADTGYRSARSINRGTNHVLGDLYAMRIVYVTDSLSVFRRAITPAS